MAFFSDLADKMRENVAPRSSGIPLLGIVILGAVVYAVFFGRR